MVLIKITPGSSLLFIFQLTLAYYCRHNMQFIHTEGKFKICHFDPRCICLRTRRVAIFLFLLNTLQNTPKGMPYRFLSHILQNKKICHIASC